LKTDSIFYRIFSASPGILFELLGRSPDLARGYEFRSVEVKQVAFRLDGILLPTAEASDQTVWFVEVQFQRDLTFYQRFFAELYLYLDLHPQTVDWQAIVVFPNQSIEPVDRHLYRSNLNSDQVHRVYLEDFRATSAESIGIGLMQLIMSNSADAIPKAKELLSRTQPLSKTDVKFAAIIELIETIVVYKFPSLSREAIENMLGLSELRQTRVYQEALEEGIAQGEQRGRAEGRTEEARSLVLRQLTHKFGSIPSDIEAQIQTLALPQIEVLGEALLDFIQLADLIAWLEPKSIL
jgi:predicted transposase/invertase (TIGR01784 family)